jgi:HSP20 family protein
MTMKAKEIPVKLAKTEKAAPMNLWNRDFPFTNSPFMRRPFNLMRNIAEDMENMLTDYRYNNNFPKLFDFDTDLFDKFYTEDFDWTPPFEMFERDGRWIVRAELPGMDKKDIVVEINDNYLTLKGKRENKFEETKEGFYKTEFTYGDFYRRLPLLEGVETKDAKALFNNGVLEISFAAPKLAIKGKRLEITEGDPKKMVAKA